MEEEFLMECESYIRVSRGIRDVLHLHRQHISHALREDPHDRVRDSVEGRERILTGLTVRIFL